MKTQNWKAANGGARALGKHAGFQGVVIEKPFHGQPKPKDVPADMRGFPPVPCAFNAGDRVTYTNDQGVKFPGRVVRGFSSEVQSWGGFIYLAGGDSWWFPVAPKNLTLES